MGSHKIRVKLTPSDKKLSSSKSSVVKLKVVRSAGCPTALLARTIRARSGVARLPLPAEARACENGRVSNEARLIIDERV